MIFRCGWYLKPSLKPAGLHETSSRYRRIKTQRTGQYVVLFLFTKKIWPSIVTRILAITIKNCCRFLVTNVLQLPGNPFLRFTSHASMITNTVQVCLAYTCVRQKAPTFWETEKQVAKRGVGMKQWQQPGRLKKGLVTPPVRKSGLEMKPRRGRWVNFKSETSLESELWQTQAVLLNRLSARKDT